MSTPFDPKQGPIYVEAEVSGPMGRLNLQLILDTGATTSLINLPTLLALGYDPDADPNRFPMTTGSGVEMVPRVVLTRLTALGRHCFGLAVMAHRLPPTPRVDGLLGLDFFRDQLLAIDFRLGQINLS